MKNRKIVACIILMSCIISGCAGKNLNTDKDIPNVPVEENTESTEMVTPDSSDFQTEDDGNGGKKIVKYNGSAKYIVIPSEIDGMPVTTIGRISFMFSEVKNVVIPDSVTVIEEKAFRNSKLVNITIGNCTESIASRAFESCKELISVEIPDSVTEIGENAFMSCNNMQELKIGNGVKEIKNNTFLGCGSNTKGLTVIMSDNLINIGEKAFYASGVKEIEFPDNLLSIGSSAFENCCKLEKIVIPDKIKTLEDYTFSNCWSLADITLPSELERIGENCFKANAKLSCLKLPDSVIEISENFIEPDMDYTVTRIEYKGILYDINQIKSLCIAINNS